MIESKGVVACDGRGHGCVLWSTGVLYDEIHESGLVELSDLSLDDAPLGVSIWEGRFSWVPGNWEHPNDGDLLPVGGFRSPTSSEWEAIRAGVCPWQGEKRSEG